jgi:hypothetical protein
MWSPRSGVARSFADFSKWLTDHPLDGDRIYGGSSVRYQVARYCDYLHANPWNGGDPLRLAQARDGALQAYGVYLATFGTPDAEIGPILANIDHFYVFLGLGAAADRCR